MGLRAQRLVSRQNVLGGCRVTIKPGEYQSVAQYARPEKSEQTYRTVGLVLDQIHRSDQRLLSHVAQLPV